MQVSYHPPMADKSAMGAIHDSVGKLVSQAQIGMTLTLKATRDLEFPNRVIHRAHRRFIGPWCLSRYPDIFTNLHYRPSLAFQPIRRGRFIAPTADLSALGGCSE